MTTCALALAGTEAPLGPARRRWRRCRPRSARRTRCSRASPAARRARTGGARRRTVARSAATKPAAPMPTAATSSCGARAAPRRRRRWCPRRRAGWCERCGVSRRARASDRRRRRRRLRRRPWCRRCRCRWPGPSAMGSSCGSSASLIGMGCSARGSTSRPGRTPGAPEPSARVTVDASGLLGCRLPARSCGCRQVGEHRRGQGGQVGEPVEGLGAERPQHGRTAAQRAPRADGSWAAAPRFGGVAGGSAVRIGIRRRVAAVGSRQRRPRQLGCAAASAAPAQALEEPGGLLGHRAHAARPRSAPRGHTSSSGTKRTRRAPRAPTAASTTHRRRTDGRVSTRR